MTSPSDLYPHTQEHVSIDPLIHESVNQRAEQWVSVIDEQPSYLRAKFRLGQPDSPRDFQEVMRKDGVNQLVSSREVDELFESRYTTLLVAALRDQRAGSEQLYNFNALASVGRYGDLRAFAYQQFQSRYSNDTRGTDPQMTDIFFIPESHVGTFFRNVAEHPDLIEAIFRRRYSTIYRGPEPHYGTTGTQIAFEQEFSRTQAAGVKLFSVEHAVSRGLDYLRLRDHILDEVPTSSFSHPIGEVHPFH